MHANVERTFTRSVATLPVAFRNLDRRQKRAVTHMGEPLLVLAGPGTGKTEVLTHRIAHLINNQDVTRQEILAVTFSRRAANNMRRYLEGLGVSEEEQPHVSTLHAEALRLLGEMEVSFRFLVDGYEAKMLIRDAASDLNLGTGYRSLREFEKSIQLLKGSNKLPEEIPDDDKEASIVRQLYERYEQLLTYNQAIDLNGLVLKVVRLLEDPGENGDELQTRYLLVDEYQDINLAEYRFIQILAENAESIFVVGDNDQSIYGWRGADPTIIREFCDCFGDGRVEILRRSFRCPGHILAGALSVVSSDPEHHEKPLRSGIGDGSLIHVLNSPSDVAEAAWVADWISHTKVELDKIAVLCKMLNLAEHLSGILRGYNIAATFWRSKDLFTYDEIRTALAYIRFLVDPNDNLALRIAMRNPTRGIGHVAIRNLRHIAEKNACALWDIVVDAERYRNLSRWRHNFRGFVSRIEQIREECDNLDIDGAIRLIAREIGVSRSANVQKMRRFAQSLEADISLEDFLAEVNQNRGVDLAGGVDAPEEEEDAVALMTMHSAKGLTYDVVFMLGMDERIFPNLNQDIDEQRRLCYVAMTRAKKELFLCHSTFRSGPPARGVGFFPPSRFVLQIPKEHKEEINL